MGGHDAADAVWLGAAPKEARLAVVLLHGRGSSGEDIAGLTEALNAQRCAFVAPSAANGAWYPQRFFVPTQENEPWLSSALGVVDELVRQLGGAGLAPQRIGFIGFSQGACLALEYAARAGRRHAFVGALSGALIGPLDTARQAAELQGMPILLGCAERDPHIPLEYVEKSAETLTGFGAAVTKQIYPGSAHSVFRPEIDWLNSLIAPTGT